MAIAYICVLIVALLPYIWTSIAKSYGSHYNNHDPRSWVEKQTSPKMKRGHAAHLNSFEAFPAFAAAVIMAQLAGVAPVCISGLAVAFVVARILHGIFYIADKPLFRSLIWALGMLCVITLFVWAIIKAF